MAAQFPRVRLVCRNLVLNSQVGKDLCWDLGTDKCVTCVWWDCGLQATGSGLELTNRSCGAQELREEFDIDVRLLGVATSSRMALSDSGIDLSSWREDLDR